MAHKQTDEFITRTSTNRLTRNHQGVIALTVSIASRADRTRTMKKDKRELGKLRLLVSITLASICVRDLKRDLECGVRCTKRIYIKAQAQPAFYGSAFANVWKARGTCNDCDVLSDMYDQTASLFHTPCILIAVSEMLES